MRPGFYVFNKNTLAGREEYMNVILAEEKDADDARVRTKTLVPSLSPAELVEVQSLMNNPAANIMYAATKKGGLNVLITEVKE